MLPKRINGYKQLVRRKLKNMIKYEVKCLGFDSTKLNIDLFLEGYKRGIKPLKQMDH